MTRTLGLFLLTYTMGVASETIWRSETAFGPVEINVTGLAADSTPYAYRTVTMEGVLLNKTSVDFGRLRLEPVFVMKDGTESEAPASYSIIVGSILKTGAEFPFRRSAMTELNLQKVAQIRWKLAFASVRFRYHFAEPAIAKRVQGAIVTAKVGASEIGVVVENNSDTPIEIIWDETSIIDSFRNAQRVFHIGVKYTDREKSQPNTLIPPLAKIRDEITPSANAFFKGEWIVKPLLEDELMLESAPQFKSFASGKLALFLQLMIGGKKVPVTCVFEILSLESGTERWTNQEGSGTKP